MTTADRARQERIRDRITRPVTERPPSRVYSSGGSRVDWCVVRHINATTKEMWGQLLRFTTDPPDEDQIEAYGPFLVLYPAPGQRVEAFTGWLYPLLTADEALAIYPTGGSGGVATAYNVSSEEFSAAMEAEHLAGRIAPQLVLYNPYPTPVPPFWFDPNPEFLDEAVEISEGSNSG